MHKVDQFPLVLLLEPVQSDPMVPQFADPPTVVRGLGLVRVRVSRGYIIRIGAVRAITGSWTYALGDNLF